MISYREDRCGINTPLLASTIFWPAAVLACLAGIVATANPLLFLPAWIALMGAGYSMAPFGLLMARRIDIRVDSDGIRIGAIRAADAGKAPTQPVAPQAQRKTVFAAPWSAIQRAEVVTDRRELKKLRRVGQDLGIRHAPVVAAGRLWSPQIRAALVINVDVGQVTWPQFMEVGEVRYTRLGQATNRRPWRRSSVWLAPTRHPRELRDVLARAAAAGLFIESGFIGK